MPTANAAEQIKIGATLSGDDARRFREFMTESGYTSANVAMRVLLLGALYDYPKWGVVTAERRAEVYEFQIDIRQEFLKKLDELKQSVMDDLAMRERTYAHQT